MWQPHVMVYVIVMIPVVLVLGLLNRMRPRRGLRVGFSAAVLGLGVAMIALFVAGALEKPALRAVVALLGLVLAVGGPVMLRDAWRSRRGASQR